MKDDYAAMRNNKPKSESVPSESVALPEKAIPTESPISENATVPKQTIPLDTRPARLDTGRNSTPPKNGTPPKNPAESVSLDPPPPPPLEWKAKDPDLKTGSAKPAEPMKMTQAPPPWMTAKPAAPNTPAAVDNRTKGQKRREKEKQRKLRAGQQHPPQPHHQPHTNNAWHPHNPQMHRPVEPQPKRGWSGWDDNSNWQPVMDSYTGPVFTDDAYSTEVDPQIAMDLMPPPSMIPARKTVGTEISTLRKKAFEKGKLPFLL